MGKEHFFLELEPPEERLRVHPMLRLLVVGLQECVLAKLSPIQRYASL